MAASDAHSDELLRSREVDGLSAQDRGLTTTLVLGTLRWQLALDERIRGLLARPETKLSAEVETTLRMGAYQLLHLDRVPPHAVVHDAVELVKEGRERGAAGMVNAVLRKIQRSERRAQSAEAAHPEWMVERWRRRYGRAAAEAICIWDQEPAGVALRISPGADLGGVETEPGFFLTAARRGVDSDIARSMARSAGTARIQDEGSQLVAEIASGAGAGARRVLDLCAAPGGKTAILAERLPDAEIMAIDVSRKRLDAMQRAMPQVLSERMRFEVADAAKMELNREWDLVLCDVPCSGTGTMARNPEIRLRAREADLARQHARQAAILRSGLRALKAGGRLVYSTCSLEPEENEAVVAEVLEAETGLRVLPVAEVLEELAERAVVTMNGRERLRSATDREFLRTLPGIHPCDGFFAAILEKS